MLTKNSLIRAFRITMRLFTFLLLVPMLACGQSAGVNNSVPEGSGPPNSAPVWNNTPSPSFVLGQAASYSLVPGDVSDPEDDALTIVNEAGCTLPTGVTLDDPNDEIDYSGAGSAAVTSNCVFSADDGTASPVNSSAFSITIAAVAAPDTIYERDLLGNPRSGTIGANEPDASPPTFPVAEITYALDIDYTLAQWACDDTILTSEPNWSGVDWSTNDVICLQAGDHTAKGRLTMDTSGTLGSTLSVSAITLSNPVRVDFTGAHSLTTGDIIHCDGGTDGTWQMRWRFFVVTVIDGDTVDLDDQDGTGTGLQPAWDTYSANGACVKFNPKVLRHATDITANPVTLSTANKAVIDRLNIGSPGEGNTIGKAMILGVTVSHKGLQSAIGADVVRHYGADWVIYDRFEYYNVEALTDPTADKTQDIIKLSGGSDTQDQIFYVTVQNSVCHEPGAGDENSFIQVTDNGRAVRIINNESQDCKLSVLLNEGDHDGYTVAGNVIYSTSDYQTDCSGNFNSSDTNTIGIDNGTPCFAIEGPQEMKGGHSSGAVVFTATNRHQALVIDANVQMAWRLEDLVVGKSSDGRSGNISFGFSANDKDKWSALFRNNVVIDTTGGGVPTGPSSCNTTTGIENNRNTVVGNLMYNIGSDAWNHYICSADNFNTHEYIHNTIVNAGNWLERTSRFTNTTIECNLLIDAGTRIGAANPSGYEQTENYGYGDTTNMDSQGGSGDVDGGVTSNALMGDWTINPLIHTSPSYTYTLTGVLSTGSSPHVSGCTAIGTSGRGMVNDTVTY